MNTDNTTCMYCRQLITDTSAPARFCSQVCFDTLLAEVKAEVDRRYREARANGKGPGNGAVPKAPKPLPEIMQALIKPAAPKPRIHRRV
jgi:hypothetical protein